MSNIKYQEDVSDNVLSSKQESLCRAIHARKKALQAEKERSAKVAALPPPPPNPVQVVLHDLFCELTQHT